MNAVLFLSESKILIEKTLSLSRSLKILSCREIGVECRKQTENDIVTLQLFYQVFIVDEQFFLVPSFLPVLNMVQHKFKLDFFYYMLF